VTTPEEYVRFAKGQKRYEQAKALRQAKSAK